MPATRTDFWSEKFAKNVARDRAAVTALTQKNWTALVFWECATRDTAEIQAVLRDACGVEAR